ncbi:MAG TPA: nucleoside diphosphate kinase regulator [Bacteroidales bacterium]|nr:nucleoside diphosphate kinase regulator [Bacteroidales bacterium]
MKKITVTKTDYQHLKKLTGNPVKGNTPEHLIRLYEELERAKKVESIKVEPDVVTMNTEIEFTDLDTNTTRRLKLVYPQFADIKKGHVSILAPIGTALLGYRKGDVVEWEVPGGKKKFLIKDIIYQPEANGDLLA